MLSVVADLGVAGVAAAEPARQVGMPEVPAPRLLAEVAADGAHLPQLGRGDRARRRGQRRVPLGDAGVGRERGHGGGGTDPQTLAVGLDAA